MNFMFEWQELYLTSERSERVRYSSCHENIKFISSSLRVMYFLLYQCAVFDYFPKFSDHCPKISKDFSKLFRRSDQQFRTFSEHFQRLPKITEDYQRRPKKIRRCVDHTLTNFSVVEGTKEKCYPI